MTGEARVSAEAVRPMICRSGGLSGACPNVVLDRQPLFRIGGKVVPERRLRRIVFILSFCSWRRRRGVRNGLGWGIGSVSGDGRVSAEAVRPMICRSGGLAGACPQVVLDWQLLFRIGG